MDHFLTHACVFVIYSWHVLNGDVYNAIQYNTIKCSGMLQYICDDGICTTDRALDWIDIDMHQFFIHLYGTCAFF